MYPPLPIRAKLSRLGEQGFTLIELLVVIAIIGILAALLMPVIKSIRESTWQAGCAFRMNKCATASLVFASENKNRLPRLNVSGAEYLDAPFAAAVEPDKTKRVINNNAGWGAVFWQEMIRPYLENNNSFNCPKLTLPASGGSGGGKSDTEQLGIGINISDVAELSNTEKPVSKNLEAKYLVWTTKAMIPSPSQVVWFMDAAGEALGADAQDIDWLKRPDFPATGASYFRGSSLVSGGGTNAVGTDGLQTNVTPRHRKKANACFVDGHVVMVEQKNITRSYDPTNPVAVGFTKFK